LPVSTRDDLGTLDAGRRSRPSKGRTLAALARLSASPPRDPSELLRLHEALLFHAAYPESVAVRSRSLALLSRIPGIVRSLADAGEDLSVFNEPETAGVGGTDLGTTFSFDFLRFLVRRHGRRVAADWDAFPDAGPERLGATLPRLVPLLEEEALADANVPYGDWLAAARGSKEEDELPWLLSRFEALPLPPRERAELFDSIGLPVRWSLAGPESRTLARTPRPRRPFLHPGPLLSRRDVDLAGVLAAPRFPLRRLSPSEAGRRLDFIRDATGVRYRELYGFTYGDPGTALTADAGRGCELTLFGLPPERRLPLRAGYAAFIVKNGIPVGYVEGLAIFERIEVGFNVYYTFREGESAWIFAMILKLFSDALGVTSFSLDPYQVGHDNEEGIESGAFWFYRRLGFASTSPALRELTAREEESLAGNPKRRTPARVLRRLAEHNLLYGENARDWERFHIRNVGLAVDRRMAREFGGDAGLARTESARRVGRILGVDAGRLRGEGRRAFESLALVLDALPDLARWSREEKRGAAEVLKAKAGKDETRYLRLMRRHERMREAFLRLGRPNSRRALSQPG
jgi:hypothetical protein